MTVGKSLALILASVAFTASNSAAAQGERDIVQIDSGKLAGAPGRDPSVRVFKGIPYVAPPVGELRWREPKPVKPWRGIRDATKFGFSCPQHLRPGQAMEMSEDCLTANVWTGARSASERRPVYVWIYGGGFNEGTGSDPQFDGEGLAKKGVVVVTFNYRVGPFGFLASPELSKESGKGSGNFGLLDDIAMLQWVQRNIEAFGGDPARVTIGGQSAGAGSVGFLSMSPLAKGLFHRSIAESQVRYPRDPELRYLNTSWRSRGQAEAAGVKYVADKGGRSLKTLRQLPWQKLLEGSNVADESVDTGTAAKPPLFRPAIDGWVLPQGYSETLRAGAQHSVFYLAGNNLDESGAVPETAFDGLRAQAQVRRAGMPNTQVTLAAYDSWARGKFGAMSEEFLRLYPAATDMGAARASNAAIRDNSRISTWLWAREWTRSVQKPVFTYFWTHALVGPSAKSRGAFHGSELMYMFNSLDANDLPWTDEDRKVADTMSSYFANYIATGDPNGAGLKAWPAFDPAHPRVMEVGDGFGPMPIASSSERLDFWQRYFKTQAAW